MILKVEDKSLFIIHENYRGTIREEGLYSIEIIYIDSTHVKDNYVTCYFMDLQSNLIYDVKLFLSSNRNHDDITPLESMVYIVSEDLFDNAVFSVEFKQLLGVSCQIKVERVGKFYNVTDVFLLEDEEE